VTVEYSIVGIFLKENFVIKIKMYDEGLLGFYSLLPLAKLVYHRKFVLIDFREYLTVLNSIFPARRRKYITQILRSCILVRTVVPQKSAKTKLHRDQNVTESIGKLRKYAIGQKLQNTAKAIKTNQLS